MTRAMMASSSISRTEGTATDRSDGTEAWGSWAVAVR
jgi:hypothetical protein